MVRLKKIRYLLNAFGTVAFITTAVLSVVKIAHSQTANSPNNSSNVVTALNASQWQELENGLQVIRAMTEDGVVLTAFKISPDDFTFSIALQNSDTGSRVKEIGEQEGAVVASNAGFFAITDSDVLYPIGYLRLNEKVHSKGWPTAGGAVAFKPGGIRLTPSHKGLPAGKFDVIQSKPMLIEPGGNWAMGSNSGLPKPRTILCLLEDGNVILSTVTRVGLTLFEAGWIMRSSGEGGFFGCDAALAFDGGRSTQIWYSGDEKYSSSGISPVHNFFVVRQKED